MKKIYLRVFIAAVILLPTCFAILSFLNARTAPVQTSSVTSMELIAPDGSILKFDANKNKEAEFIRFFIELGNNAHSVEKLPSELEDADCYRAVYISRANKQEYRYYFSLTKPSSSYFVDSEGNAFRIDAADTIEFLDSDYSSGLYTYSRPPKLTAIGTSDGKSIEASTTDWSYYTYSNLEQKVNEQKDTIQTLTASYDDFSLQFDTFPDESNLKITNDAGETLYTGSYTDFIKEKHLKKFIRKDTLLHFDLTAHWDYTPSPGYGGDASYRFDLQVVFDPNATFWLGEQVVELGDLVVLSGMYIENFDELSVSVSPSIAYQPKFYTDGEYVRALIPISQASPEGAGDYEIRVNYMGIVHTLTLKVKSTSYAESVKDYHHTGLDTSARTEEALEAFSHFIASLPYEETALFDGSFDMDLGEKTRAAFGNTIDNTSSADDRFISNGIAFVSYKGTQIHAVNNGKVIAVDETAYGGNTIVIDHGLGLRSVYYCVGKTAVTVGDMVSTGSIIGSGADDDGYADGITAYCELWVGDVPVSYYPLTESGRTGMIVYGEEP